MRLKRLSLQGYKTFATKTDFEFDEGITAIVGPNGSGKSNIADALRWVLGEQSYSTLRGKRTIDMIFAGSQKRSRAGMAQAILTLDNSDGWLPIEFTEVEIGRRAFRSGENEYILNGQRVRLRDVSELLAKSGLAERTYTIIGQGLVDQALSLRAEERRSLFEEAAGVSHYKMQRAEAIRKLQETERNLERVQDILAELKPRVGHLRRQAERAQNYDQIAADLRHHLRVWYGFHWRKSRDVLRHSRQTSDQAQQAWLHERDEQRKIHEKYDRQRDLAGQLQAKLRTMRDEREELRGQAEHALRQLAVLEERHKLLGSQLSEIEQEVPTLLSERLTAQQELEMALEELGAADRVLATKRADLAKFQSSFDSQRLESDRLQQLVDDLEAKQRSNQRALAQAQGQLMQLRQQVEELAVKRIQQPDLVETEQLVASAHTAVASAEREVAVVRASRDTLESERQETASSLAEFQAAVRRNEELVNSLQKERAQLETKAEMLGRLRRVDVEMPESTGLAGRLLHLMSIPDDYQHATEAALLDRLNTLLVDNSATLWQILRRNRDRRLLVASVSDLRPPPPLPLPEHPAAVGWLGELVQCEETAKPLVQLLLGRVLLVEDAAAAFQLATTLPEGCTTVTGDGFLAYAGGLVETQPAKNHDGVLAREREWHQVANQLEQLNAGIDGHQQALEDGLRSQARAQAELNRLAEQETELAQVEAGAVRLLGESQRDLDKALQQHDFVLREQESVAETEQRLSLEIASLQQTIEKHEAAADSLMAQLAVSNKTLEALPVNEVKDRVFTLQDQVDSAQTIMAGRQAVVDSRRATLNQVEDRLQRLVDRQSRLKAEYRPQDLDTLRERSAGLNRQLAVLDDGLRPQQEQLRQIQVQLTQLEKAEAELQRRAYDLETHYTQSRIELSQRENQVEGLRERIRSDLGLVALDYDDDEPGQSPLPIAEVIEYLPQTESLPDDTESTIQLLRGQLNRMGGVNPEAPLEYEETRNRYDFLTQQVGDLTQTQERLRQVIDELDRLTSRAFVETVNKVDGIFGEVFRRLFGGGSAQLVLTDPDDLTITGVDIVARLPRRREQSLALLSGGERSLTAAALIFALLKVAPTPFCVLDEVDAMLDEANVTRFREMLQELSDQTQIIVITHNRGTVEAAKAVYGVSMGADSASQVLSIRPEVYLQRRTEH